LRGSVLLKDFTNHINNPSIHDRKIHNKIFIGPSHSPIKDTNNKSPYPNVCFLYNKDVIKNGIPRYPIPNINPKNISFIDSMLRKIKINSVIIRNIIKEKGIVKVRKSIIDIVMSIELIHKNKIYSGSSHPLINPK